MKKLIIAVWALAAVFAIYAKPEGKGGKEAEKLPNYDEEMNQACAFLAGRIDNLSSALSAALNGRAIYDPAKSSLLDGLQEAADCSLNTKTKAKGSWDGSEGEQTVYRMREVLAQIDSGSKSGLSQLVRNMRGNEVVRRYSTLDRCARRIEVRSFTKMMDEFDSGWDSFKQLTAEMKASKAVGVTGSELIVAAGLERFVTPKTCKASPSFDREMRNLDSYLAQMKSDELDAFETALKTMDKYIEKAGKGLAEEWGRCRAAKIHPAYKAKIEELLTNEELFVGEVGTFVKTAMALLAKIRDPSSEIGKLRTVSGFAPHHAFTNPCPPPSPTGVQNYIQRVRLILADAKESYLAALAVCNRAARESDQKDIRGWQ